MKTLIILLSLFISSYSFGSRDITSDVYRWQSVKKDQLTTTFPVVGQVIAEEGALHFQSARVGGRILSLKMEEGSFVKKGSTIFHITGPECVTIREEKRIALKANLTDLLETIKQRQRELNIKVTDTDCHILADSDGILVKRNVNAGSAFNQGDSLAQILEVSKLRIEIEVPEKSASLIQSGSKVLFKIPSLSNFKSESTIQQVFPLVDEGTRVMKARLKKVPLPANTKLNSMVFADVSLSEDALCFIVPITAVTLQDSASWIIKKGEKIEKIPVTILSTQSDRILINPVKAGDIKEGDLVATQDTPFLFQEIKKMNPKD